MVSQSSTTWGSGLLRSVKNLASHLLAPHVAGPHLPSGQPGTAGAASVFVKSLAPSGGVPKPYLHLVSSPVLAQAASPWEVMQGSPLPVPPPGAAGTQTLGKVWESACVQAGALNTAPRQGRPTWLRQGVALMALVKASESTGVLWRLSREQQEGYTGV